jgi:hypothetical protein
MASPFHRGEMAEDLYGPDLAHVHDVAFGAWARDAAPFVCGRLREAGIADGLVVDLGCGSGIGAAELLAAGYDVLGVDASAEMLALAREWAPGARFLPSLEPLLRRVHDALEPDGLLVFDAAGPGREPELHRRARHEGDGWLMRVEMREDRAARTLTRRIALVRDGRASEELHVLRLYEPGDVVDWLETAGFTATRHPSYGAARGLPGVYVYVAARPSGVV